MGGHDGIRPSGHCCEFLPAKNRAFSYNAANTLQSKATSANRALFGNTLYYTACCNCAVEAAGHGIVAIEFLAGFIKLSHTLLLPMCSGKSGPKDQVALHYYYTSPSHWCTTDSRGIEIVNFTISLALSAGTLMASAGTPYRLVPAHFYPCQYVRCCLLMILVAGLHLVSWRCFLAVSAAVFTTIFALVLTYVISTAAMSGPATYSMLLAQTFPS